MKKNYKIWITAFLFPALALFCIVYLASVTLMFGSSFTDWKLLSRSNFIGLSNYFEIFFKDSTFFKALINTSIWVLLQSTVHVAIGVTFALILAKKEFYWKFARTVYMIPNIISGAALGMMYLGIFNPKFGLVNELIRRVGGIKDFEHNWFFDYSTAFFTVTMTWLPFAAVITILALTELSSVSESMIESARIDGASGFKIDIYILLPMIRNIIGTCVIVAATSMLRNFDTIYITTNGGPNNETLNLPLYIYKVAMIDNNYGYANAIGTFVTILGIVIIILLSRVFRMGESNV